MLQAPSLWDLIVARADATPDAPMVVDESRTTLTFGEYREKAEAAAAGLQERGVGEGSIVSWILPTTNHAFVLVGALARLGAVQNPILPIYREREVGFIAKQAKPRLLIVPGVFRGFDLEAMALGIAADKPGVEVLKCEGPIPTGDPSALPAWTTPTDDPVRWLFYTSGSTADPKGAQHTDRTILAVSKGMAECLDLKQDDRNGLVFPFTHIAGPIWLGSGLMVGLCHLVMAAFDPVETVKFFKEQDVTIAGSGTMFHMAYLNAQRENADQPGEKLFPSVRNFPGGGAPKPPQLYYDMKTEMGAPILSGYGLTEAPILTMARASDPDDKLANTEGAPMPGVELKLVTLDGEVAAPGEEGEIRTKAPQVMKGYLDSSLDAEGFDEEGYFRTGDLGRLDDGYIVITGRVKDIIIRKGENISAKEVEDLLFTHPKVADVAVIGLPDPSSGERACAVVVSKAEGDALSMDDMRDFLKDKGLRMQAIPEQIEVVDALPRNPAGKVLKQDLKKVYS